MKKVFTLFAALMMVLSMNAATKTIYCKMAQSWWKADGAAVGAYYWEPGSAPAWPGVRMTPVTGETDLWSVDIDTDKYTKIIFTRVNGSGTVSDCGAKTADLILPTDDKNLYTITSTSPVWGNPGVAGNWSVYAPDAPKTYKDITITIVANATPKIHYWEGGDKMVGTEWGNLPEMTATGEANTYSCTIKDVDEATGVKYLVMVGDIQSADQQAFENVNKNFKELLAQVSVMGIPDWTGSKMTVADDYLSASVTLTLDAAKDYEFKLTINGEWFGSKDITITKDNNSAAFAENGDGNGKLTTDLAGDYVFTYTYATKTLVVTYPVPTYTVTVTAENGTVEGDGEYKKGTEVTLTATPAEGYQFVNWTVGEEVVSTENPYTFTVTADVVLVANFKAVEPEVITYELNGGEFPAVVVPTNEELAMAFKQEYAEYFAIEGLTDTDMNREVGNFIYVTNSKGGDAVKFITENANWKWLHDYILTVAGNIPEGTNVGYYWRANIDGFFHCKNAVLVGGVASADFTEAGKPEAWGAAYEAEYGVVLPTEPVAEDYVLPTPVKEGYTFVGWYDNAEGTGKAYTVIPAGWAGTLYAIWKQGTTTALENIAVEGKAVKAIINGQLVIIKNGVQYNAQGAILK